MRPSEPTDISAQLSGVALMRGFRIIHHTENVGEAGGAGTPEFRGGTDQGPQKSRVSKEFRLRRRWPALGHPSRT